MSTMKHIELPDEVAEQILQSVLCACQMQPSSLYEAKKRLEVNTKQHVRAQIKHARAKKNPGRAI